MFATSGDILNMSLALGFIVLVIFLSILIFYGILVLRDLSKIVEDVNEVTSKVHDTVMAPLRTVDYLIEKAKPYLEALIEKKMGGGKKKS